MNSPLETASTDLQSSPLYPQSVPGEAPQVIPGLNHGKGIGARLGSLKSLGLNNPGGNFDHGRDGRVSSAGHYDIREDILPCVRTVRGRSSHLEVQGG